MSRTGQPPRVYTRNASQADYDRVARAAGPRPDRISPVILGLVLALVFISAAAAVLMAGAAL